jgi:DNA-binding MarR family transcriptional regulator
MTEPDFAILVTGCARVVADRLGGAVERSGVADMRSSFGFVIRALSEHDATLTDLAATLAVTKQAAIKVVDEMEARGFVARATDPRDRRAKAIALTPRGEAVRRAARAESERMEAELAAELGDADVAALRRVLLRFVERHGGGEDAAAGRARPVW